MCVQIVPALWLPSAIVLLCSARGLVIVRVHVRNGVHEVMHVGGEEHVDSVMTTNIIHAASAEQIDKAKEVIKKLTFKYQPDAFENPGGPYNIITVNIQTVVKDNVQIKPQGLLKKNCCLEWDLNTRPSVF